MYCSQIIEWFRLTYNFSGYISRIVVVESSIFIASGWLLKFDEKTGEIDFLTELDISAINILKHIFVDHMEIKQPTYRFIYVISCYT